MYEIISPKLRVAGVSEAKPTGTSFEEAVELPSVVEKGGPVMCAEGTPGSVMWRLSHNRRKVDRMLFLRRHTRRDVCASANRDAGVAAVAVVSFLRRRRDVRTTKAKTWKLTQDAGSVGTRARKQTSEAGAAAAASTTTTTTTTPKDSK